MVYRAYRVPYEWIPQLEKPEEIPIPRKDCNLFRMPGAGKLGEQRVVKVEGVRDYNPESQLCVLATDRE